MSNTKFKSGDKVVFRKSSLESGMIDAKEGDVFTVSEFSEEHWGDVVRLQGMRGVISTSHIEHYVEKEKVMEKYIPKVGDKVKGFKFYGYCYPDIGYAESMNDVIGKEGTVYSVSEGRFVIDFGDNCWTYPLQLAHLAKIEESSQETSHEDSQIDWQGSQINWQVGQEVWDCAYGKGIVESVSLLDDEVHVQFERFNTSFNYDVNGIIYGGNSRTLFFSEPKIIAETKPPKKPFTPVFYKGDTLVAKKKDGQNTTVFYVEEETDISVKSSCYSYAKDLWNFYKISEKVEF